MHVSTGHSSGEKPYASQEKSYATCAPTQETNHSHAPCVSTGQLGREKGQMHLTKHMRTQVSTEGLQPSIFPDGIPVYTGHYHTPQVHGNIRYLGSPYQLSLSEAEDRKSLLVLDDHWHVVEQIPLDIGRKQYKWTANELLTRSDILKANDRVSVSCSLTDNSVSELLMNLKERGVNVQIRRLTTETSTRVENQKICRLYNCFRLMRSVQRLTCNQNHGKIFFNG